MKLTAKEDDVLKKIWKLSEQGACYVWWKDVQHVTRKTHRLRSLVGVLGSLVKKGVVRMGNGRETWAAMGINDDDDDLCVTCVGAELFDKETSACFGCSKCSPVTS